MVQPECFSLFTHVQVCMCISPHKWRVEYTDLLGLSIKPTEIVIVICMSSLIPFAKGVVVHGLLDCGLSNRGSFYQGIFGSLPPP